MESLLANYASSDVDEPQQITHPPTIKDPSVPPPKISSLFSSLPQPKQLLKSDLNVEYDDGCGKVASGIPKLPIPDTKDPSKLFSHLPQPQQPSSRIAKRIVQFKPPINPSNHVGSDDDDNDEEEEIRKHRESENLAHGPSVKSFLSSIPVPRNSATLGVAPSSGSGRRSIIETTRVATSTFEDKSEASVDSNAPSYSNYDRSTDANDELNIDQNPGNYYVNYAADYSNYQ